MDGAAASSDGAAAVVDPKLKVYGLEGLRVAYASVPTLIGCSTDAPTIMIGEKAADMIRADIH